MAFGFYFLLAGCQTKQQKLRERGGTGPRPQLAAIPSNCITAIKKSRLWRWGGGHLGGCVTVEECAGESRGVAFLAVELIDKK